MVSPSVGGDGAEASVHLNMHGGASLAPVDGDAASRVDLEVFALRNIKAWWVLVSVRFRAVVWNSRALRVRSESASDTYFPTQRAGLVVAFCDRAVLRWCFCEWDVVRVPSYVFRAVFRLLYCHLWSRGRWTVGGRCTLFMLSR